MPNVVFPSVLIGFGFEMLYSVRFWMLNVVFPLVLIGLGCKMLYSLRFSRCKSSVFGASK